ncbi:glycosyltransferase family 2 protein [Nibrella saemangeumensis]|uniref:Glycosyltransferase family 2 protein n=1 Tax=Nibrella saemangeumensis TaxID=1084526 RepID=A0ABP8MHY3_9BACT
MISYSLIICTYNRASFLKETIESILSHFRSKTNFELLIINNNSTDNTADVVKPFLSVPVVRYVVETNQGLSHARNRGIKEARNEILVFLDDDIDIEPNYLDVSDQLFRDPANQIVGGKVLPYNSGIPEWLPEQYYYIISIFDRGDSPLHTDKLMGANYAMRKEAALKIGWYNTELGRKGSNLMGGEEVDYLDRARAIGYSVLYHPGLVVYHKIGNKLNKDYVFDYAFNLGKSERIIDGQRSTVKVLLKYVKYILMILLYYVYGSYAPNPKQQTYFTINYLYGLGYLGQNKSKQ